MSAVFRLPLHGPATRQRGEVGGRKDGLDRRGHRQREIYSKPLPWYPKGAKAHEGRLLIARRVRQTQRFLLWSPQSESCRQQHCQRYLRQVVAGLSAEAGFLVRAASRPARHRICVLAGLELWGQARVSLCLVPARIDIMWQWTWNAVLESNVQSWSAMPKPEDSFILCPPSPPTDRLLPVARSVPS